MGDESLPTGWQHVKIGDLGEVNRGRSRHRPRYAEHLYGGSYPFIQTGDIKNSGGRITTYQQTYSEAGLAQSRLWPAGTMCITIAANIAETAILSFPACFPDSVVGFIADEAKCDVCFVEFTFRHLRQHIQHEASGSVQDNINLATLDRLWFPLPPLPEQKAIAHILGTLDDKIELNRRINATLEAIAQAIFKSWFAEFDPVKAKMEGHRPFGIDADIAALFPDRMVDSDTELGMIPEGWEVSELGAFCAKPQYGYTETASDEIIGPKFLRIKDINKQPWINWQSVPYCPITEENFEKYRLRVGDIVIARMADPGHGALIEEQIAAVFASYLIRFRPKEGYYQRFLQYWLRSEPYWSLIEGQKSGTTRPNLNAKVLGHFSLVTPSRSVCSAFSNAVSPLRDKIVANIQQSQTLAALRDTLLPKLLSGEVRVKEVK